MRRARWKRKNVRRVGLRRRRPPAAGGGWLAVPRGGQGRKRAALGETFGLGKLGIPSATLPAAAHASSKNSQRQRKKKQLNASTTPTPSAPSGTGRQLQTRRRPKRARRSGKIGAGTTTPTPVRTEGHCTGVRPSALFFWTVHGPFSFRARPKRKWGVHPRWTSPLAGASPPWPPFGGPNHLRAVDNRPYAPAGSDPGIRHSPAGADLTQPAG